MWPPDWHGNDCLLPLFIVVDKLLIHSKPKAFWVVQLMVQSSAAREPQIVLVAVKRRRSAAHMFV